ncbi:NAD-dependent epimerase/dehydratase family protein [Blochmannia endosymbiont of Polyrhachis (Hedomyrma) turneri]|uniref:NAD-dependent epimerase/dehydratase family protein n=1 Tax=Blochmannia endosymbiont of Polyrhachis (Hedomyrma) turneri TaxID=1505596 RepID=UPI00061A8485|nr:NAD-dependent epimerase/dehydratase family protein [Blochmannia endosymbiont of Polyrhachis (Hedomyrma) turneri]AKC59996.1 DNA topoisomerase 3 [Blochmannia endosymbiont of Polyrhachis (Hedomyrma) turneri]
MRFLVTGNAGFIGYHVSKRLLIEGYDVIGIDNLNNYYDITLKLARLKILKMYDNFVFYKCDLTDERAIKNIFFLEKIDRVIHFGAQAGVRHSLKNPMIYATSNIIGYLNILEASRLQKINHLIYASSSSVYGSNYKLPFSTFDAVNHPVSLYGVTKRTNELMSYTYSYLYRLPTTGLRLFTVYGPWGRPDMAIFKFTKSILSGKNINIYNYGHMKRSFTFIDDVVEVVIRIQNNVPNGCDDIYNSKNGNLKPSFLVPYCVYNVANSDSIELTTLIKMLEQLLGVTAKKNLLPMQFGDVLETCSDELTDLYQVIKFKPKTSIIHGVKKFLNWYFEYHGGILVNSRKIEEL